MEPIDLLFLSQKDVIDSGLSLKDTIGIVEEVFEEHGFKRYENPPKPGIHPGKDAFIHAMPAYLKRKEIAGMKWVSGYSSNARRGLPNIMGMIVLNDVDTGSPLAVIEAGLITAMRTAAVSGVSARHLARPDATTLGIVGAGVQGRYHLTALKEALPGIETVRIFDINKPTLDDYVERFRKILPVDIRRGKSAEDVIQGSDVIVTCTGKLDQTMYWSQWIERGALVLPIHMFGWDRQAITGSDKFVVDDWEQFSTYMNLHGKDYIPLPEPYSELGEIVIKRKDGRANNAERIINFNLGIAIHDIAIGRRILDMAIEKGIGRRLRLMEESLPFSM